MFVINVRKSIDQMGALVWIDVCNREPPAQFPVCGHTVIVAHQPPAGG